MITFYRIMQAGLRNFMRNAWLSTAATAVMTVTLTIVAISLISNLALTSTIKTVTDKIDVSVYLKPDVTQDQVDRFQSELKSNPDVAAVNYVSPEQATAAYREQNKDNADLLRALDTVGTNSLPPSLQVTPADPNKLSTISSIIEKPENQALLDPNAAPTSSGSRRDTVDRIVSISNFFKSTGLIASVIFVIISTLIIFNTIRMAIFTRRDEIEIMKLVGATKWFIRGPFVFEAALYGIIGAVIATTLAYLLLLGGGPRLGNYVDVASSIALFRDYPLLIIAGEVVVGVVIGAFSSLLAMSRYLKL